MSKCEGRRQGRQGGRRSAAGRRCGRIEQGVRGAAPIFITGADRPEEVIRLILKNLMKIIGRVPRLKRYQRQLHVLSRLRKLHPISLKEIQAMPIHYDIETDDLFLAGLEKGMERQQYDTVARMLKTARFSDEEIAGIAGVSLSFVRKIRKDLKA
ncbi:MAG: hypothetical protein H6565_13945 [Lewinellaceae bacterium]|nr:hypothetical protein [Lewinellaceae bacterium]